MVSEVSITLDGITITTTTYFDGSIEVTKTAASSDASTKGAQTYNAQGVTTNSTSSGGSTAVTSCDFAQRLMSPHLA
ncbi:hypothetical protein BRADO2176 [Bradyrhizobium sp. ORS 278]|nr:hypothetical protein BRADO2176 [Bradyrhizobium sp. ORS 278]